MKLPGICFLLLLLGCRVHGQKEFHLWPGPAPGSVYWNWHEQEDSTNKPTDPLVFNVVQPSLTFFPADRSTANGTSVIICPGGSFIYLHIHTEGIDLAKWLNKRGVSAFVLKYRLAHCETDNPLNEKNERIKDSSLTGLVTPIIPMAIADAKQAIAFVRNHAAELGVDSNRIGIVGFSAGGALAVASAFDYTHENRPDFVVPIYAFVPPSLPMHILPDEPPLFIAAASDDDLHLVPMSVNIYNKWLASGHSAEMHIYAHGGHGFGMKRLGLPSDTWMDRFGDWLMAQGLLGN
jgi:acetyl esterase/lipase